MNVTNVNCTSKILAASTPGAKTAIAFAVTEFDIAVPIHNLGIGGTETEPLPISMAAKMGILAYVEENRIRELRAQIRPRVIRQLGLTPEAYRKIRQCGEIPADLRIALEEKIRAIVEHRIRQHLESEARAGAKLTNTIADQPADAAGVTTIEEVRYAIGSLLAKFPVDGVKQE